MPKHTDESNQKPKTAEEVLARIDALETEAATLKKESLQLLKDDFQNKLQAAQKVYLRIPQDERSMMYGNEILKSVLSSLNLYFARDGKPTAMGVTKTRAKRISDDVFLAYLDTDRTEAEIMAHFGYEQTTLAQKLSRLKSKKQVESKEVNGERKWKATAKQ